MRGLHVAIESPERTLAFAMLFYKIAGARAKGRRDGNHN